MAIEREAIGAREYLLGLQTRLTSEAKRAGFVRRALYADFYEKAEARSIRITEALNEMERTGRVASVGELLTESIEDNANLAGQHRDNWNVYRRDASNAYFALLQLVDYDEERIPQRARNAMVLFNIAQTL